MEKKELIFRFERGAFFGGTLCYEIEKSKVDISLSCHNMNGFAWMKNYQISIPEAELIELFRVLEPIRKWKNDYQTENMILDGYGWSISYNYAGNKVASKGYEKYPADYRRVVKEIQCKIEDLCKKYDPDYDEMGKEERINL